MANSVDPNEFFPESNFSDESTRRTNKYFIDVSRTILESAKAGTWENDGILVLEKLSAWMAALFAKRLWCRRLQLFHQRIYGYILVITGVVSKP
jgi:hypothetical protein